MSMSLSIGFELVLVENCSSPRCEIGPNLRGSTFLSTFLAASLFSIIESEQNLALQRAQLFISHVPITCIHFTRVCQFISSRQLPPPPPPA